MKIFKALHIKEALRYRMTVMIALTIVSVSMGFYADAGIPEKYGEKYTSSDGRECLRVKCYVQCDYVVSNGFKFRPNTYLEYFPDNTVRWVWNVYDYKEVEGVRIDDAGSFKIEAGGQVGRVIGVGNTIHEAAYICIYPMMQIENRNILLKEKKEIVFKVAHDNTFRVEISGIPSNASGAFGPIYTGYYFMKNDDGDYGTVGHYEKTTYLFGPYWQMFLNFILAPEGVTPDSVDEIFTDESDADSPIVDLLGNRVERNSLTLGIYIYKGKKILVK